MSAGTTLAPADAEILDAAEDFRSQYTHGGTTFDEFDEIGFARAVLAKWGAPAPASQPVAVPAQVEPFGYVHKRRGRFVHELEGVVNIDTEYHRVFTTAQVQAMLAKGLAPGCQAVPVEPLTDEQIEELAEEHGSDIDGFARAIEAAHGITTASNGTAA